MKFRFIPACLFKFSVAVFLTCTGANSAYAQSKPVSEKINEAVQLHDKGDFSGAIEVYKNILKQNSGNTQANYEIATSYFALKDYENAIKHSNYVIAANADYLEQAYMLKGSAQDMQAKPTEAVKTYKTGLSKFPKNHLLYYNLALTYFNLNNYKETDDALVKALRINPAHASSHLLLGYSMNRQGNRVKSILALSNFLMLEPSGSRSAAALEMLEDNFKNKKDNTNSVKPPAGKANDEFNTAELMLALLESSNNSELNRDKSSYEKFAGNLKALFTILGEQKAQNKGFWWNFYVDFFYSLVNENHSDAFAYYITQSKKDNVILKWLEDNNEKYTALSAWYSKFIRVN